MPAVFLCSGVPRRWRMSPDRLKSCKHTVKYGRKQPCTQKSRRDDCQKWGRSHIDSSVSPNNTFVNTYVAHFYLRRHIFLNTEKDRVGSYDKSP